MGGQSQFRQLLKALLAASCVLGVGAFGPQTPESGRAGRRESFSPVAPAAALHAALRANLKLANDWLNDQDFASAAETAEGLVVLANVYKCYSDQSAWREKATALREACEDLVARAKGKDVNGCEKASQQCARLLAELGENPPSGDRTVTNDFKPPDSTKTLMKLMDGTYADAKRAKSVGDLSNRLFTIAEIANVTRVLRSEPNWQERAITVREAALKAAETKPNADLQAARRELKNVYQQCQACHKAYKP